MEFKKYNSITNTYDQKFLDKIFIKDEYVITEKIHGSNLAFYFDGKEFKIAKRTGFLAFDEKFFNAYEVLNEWKSLIEQVFNQQKNCSELIIFGEIFGGSYPGFNCNKSKKVQKGVYYHYQNKFLAFDAMIDGELMHYDNFKNLDIPKVPELFKGTLKECLNYSNQFQSKISDSYGLPNLENNICEGVIIKPIASHFIGMSRVILKNKNEKFSEKQKVEKPAIADIPECIQKEVNELINENRLNNIVSRIGELTLKQLSSFIKELSLDALKEIDLTKYTKEEQQVLKKYLGKESAKFIKACIYKI